MLIKILLAEDSPTQAALSRMDLQTISPAIEVVWTNTAATTLEAVTHQPLASLIILDMNLPDGSGLDICRKIKTNPQTRAIPTVIFSTEPLSVHRNAAYEAGADQYITKGGTGDTTLKLLAATLLRSQLRQLPRIGEALVEAGYLKVEQLQKALQAQQQDGLYKGKVLGQILVDMGFVSEMQVNKAIKTR